MGMSRFFLTSTPSLPFLGAWRLVSSSHAPFFSRTSIDIALLGAWWHISSSYAPFFSHTSIDIALLEAWWHISSSYAPFFSHSNIDIALLGAWLLISFSHAPSTVFSSSKDSINLSMQKLTNSSFLYLCSHTIDLWSIVIPRSKELGQFFVGFNAHNSKVAFSILRNKNWFRIIVTKCWDFVVVIP